MHNSFFSFFSVFYLIFIIYVFLIFVFLEALVMADQARHDRKEGDKNSPSGTPSQREEDRTDCYCYFVCCIRPDSACGFVTY
jgi:hypothetical protein